MAHKVSPKAETGTVAYPLPADFKATPAAAPKQEDSKESKESVALFSFDKISAALEKIQDAPTYSKGKSGGIWRLVSIGQNRIGGACYDRTAKIWNFSREQEGVTCGSLQFNLRGKNTGEVLSLLVQGTTLITGSFKGKMHFWNVNTGALLKVGGEKEDHSTGFYSMAEVGGARIATGSCQRPVKHKGAWNHVVKIWNEKLGVDCQLVGHTGGISALKGLGADRLISSSADKTLRIWDLTKKSSAAVLEGHEDYVYCLGKVSNEQVLSGSRDRTIKLWDLTKGKAISSLTKPNGNIAHESTVYDIDVMGNCVVSCSRDTYVKVWDLRSSRCMKILAPEDGYVYSVAHLPNGNIAAGTDGIRDAQNKKRGRDKAHVCTWDLRMT